MVLQNIFEKGGAGEMTVATEEAAERAWTALKYVSRLTKRSFHVDNRKRRVDFGFGSVTVKVEGPGDV